MLTFEKLELLVVEDNEDHLALIKRNLKGRDDEWIGSVTSVGTLEEAADASRSKIYDAILLDLSLPDSNPLATVETGVARLCSVPIIVLTSLSNEDLGRQAIRNGAQDYLDKSDTDSRLLRRTVSYAIERFKAHNDRINELKLFAHTLAHEIRNPLQPVSMTLSLLEEGIGGELEPEIHQMVQSASSSSARVGSIITELLTYADSDGPTPFEEVDLNAVVAQVRKDLILSNAGEFELVVKNPLPSIAGSETQIRQVLENLFTNAIRYQDFGRALVIEIGSEIVDDGTKKRAVLKVSDNGVGISEENLPKIFEPFYRVAETASRHGTGLGLNFCRQVVERQGGTISATSRLGRGTTFVIALGLYDTASDQSDRMKSQKILQAY